MVEQKSAVSGMANVFSVDVEDYFQVEAFAQVVAPELWDEWPSRVVANTSRLLDLCARMNVMGTFFVLGWVAERFPELVRRIVNNGHEVACHSYAHRCIFRMTAQQFRDDTRRAKQVIEDAAGVSVIGYRAPSWSITRDSLWALEILADEGFRYDSSIYPIRHDIYGIPSAPRTIYKHSLKAGDLWEFPPATVKIGNATLPAAGGGYLRIFPLAYTLASLRQWQRAGRPMVIYVHPWEVDPEQPRIAAPLKSRLRHYTRLRSTEGKLKRLFRAATFTSFRDLIAQGEQDLQAMAASVGVGGQRN